MRTNFTSEDLKNMVEQIFNGNLRQSIVSKGSIVYNNPNSEKIMLIDDESGESEEKDLATYLNLHFYNWKERLVETKDTFHGESLSVLESWVESLNVSMNESYALVEKTDEEVIASQDIDGSTIMGKITFLIQTNKIHNLDYYITKLRNQYLGVPQDIQNSYGETLKAFLLVGALMYEQEPFTSQLGETIIVSCNIKLTYLADALTYNDNKVQISIDDEEHYFDLPITKGTYQNVFATDPVTTNARPDLTGVMVSALTSVKTLTFYDFNKPLMQELNHLFWSLPAYKVDGVLTVARTINIPVYVKIITGGHTYIFKDVIEQMEKVVTNNDFNICSLSLRTWGKVI